MEWKEEWNGGKKASFLIKKILLKITYAAKFLIKKKYSSKGKIIGMGGSAGGLLMGAVVNQSPELFLGIVMAVPFVDSLTTNLDHSLPLTVGEFDEFGMQKIIKIILITFILMLHIIISKRWITPHFNYNKLKW